MNLLDNADFKMENIVDRLNYELISIFTRKYT